MSIGVDTVRVIPVAGNFETVLDGESLERLNLLADRARRALDGRAVWNVNSTSQGGGVAEMLRSLVAIACGNGIDARWVVMEGDPDFFQVTKRLHNHLHGEDLDGGSLGDAEMAAYRETSERNRRRLEGSVRAGDIVILHDPQTAGLIPGMKALGALVIWRCHIGVDTPNQRARDAWAFLHPLVSEADIQVFSRDAYVWEGLDRGRVRVVHPSIDASSAKNVDLDGVSVDAILRATSIIPGGSGPPPSFPRQDGTSGRVRRAARLVEEAPVPVGSRVIAQVSRWDLLKDPIGVMDSFVEHVAPHSDAHLLLAGPDAEAVADDPDGAAVFRAVVERRDGVPPPIRDRVHLAALPMADAEENAIIVNAVQRRADVVVQKSIAEGFGLTVAEAMWKARPVVATRVGGIQDQIEDGESGLLIGDPGDLAACGEAVVRLLCDPALAARLGGAARDRVRAHFLAPRHLGQYVELLEPLLRG